MNYLYIYYISDAVKWAKIFSCFDLKTVYIEVEIYKADQHKIALVENAIRVSI